MEGSLPKSRNGNDEAKMTFKIGQKVSWTDAAIEYFSVGNPTLRHQLKKAQGTISDIDGEFIYVFWDQLDDIYKAQDWAIKHSEMVN